MASKEYLEFIKDIPEEIKREATLSIEVAVRIKEILIEEGLKPSDLAKKLNKNESEISKWLSGFQNFTLATLTKIETVLGQRIISLDNKKEISILKSENRQLKSEVHSLRKQNLPIFKIFSEKFKEYQSISLNPELGISSFVVTSKEVFENKSRVIKMTDPSIKIETEKTREFENSNTIIEYKTELVEQV